MMNRVLKPFISKFVVVYFDDILMYISSKDIHLKEVLATLQENKLYIVPLHDFMQLVLRVRVRFWRCQALPVIQTSSPGAARKVIGVPSSPVARTWIGSS